MSSLFIYLSLFYWNSVQNIAPAVAVDKPEVGPLALDSALQEQERIITMSYTLASEASLKSKLVAGQSLTDAPSMISSVRPQVIGHLCIFNRNVQIMTIKMVPDLH